MARANQESADVARYSCNASKQTQNFPSVSHRISSCQSAAPACQYCETHHANSSHSRSSGSMIFRILINIAPSLDQCLCRMGSVFHREHKHKQKKKHKLRHRGRLHPEAKNLDSHNGVTGTNAFLGQPVPTCSRKISCRTERTTIDRKCRFVILTRSSKKDSSSKLDPMGGLKILSTTVL